MTDLIETVARWVYGTADKISMDTARPPDSFLEAIKADTCYPTEIEVGRVDK